MKHGHLALVLNAHLPFVRRPEYPTFLEERWYFEALSETYLPLLRVFRRLDADEIPFRLTMTLSPTLCTMFADQILGNRYVSYLENQITLARQEQIRTAQDPAMHQVASLYLELYETDLYDFVTLYQRNIVGAFDFFYKRGKIELMTTGATHAFLPHYREFPEAVCAQVEVAIVSHRKHFGKQPAGFWLPQLGWYPGLGRILHAYNVNYSIVSTRGALLGEPAPRYGSFSPVRSKSGVTLFVRDAGATRDVWSETDGYPADPVYRDFYRDIGYDLPMDYLSARTGFGNVRGYTGFKYWAVTGRTQEKKPYVPAIAAIKAKEHAMHFLAKRTAVAKEAARHMDRPPVMVCPYDAELFGHWWLEGPIFLETLLRAACPSAGTEPMIAGSPEFVTLGEYAKAFPSSPPSEPEFSSWGEGGYSEVWLNGTNDWVYRHTNSAIRRMCELTERFPNETSLRERILNQAAREVLISMCSDWSFLMNARTASTFARSQVEDAISNFNRIYEMLCANTVSTEWVTKLEKRNNIFPEMNYRIFRRKR